MIKLRTGTVRVIILGAEMITTRMGMEMMMTRIETGMMTIWSGMTILITVSTSVDIISSMRDHVST